MRFLSAGRSLLLIAALLTAKPIFAEVDGERVLLDNPRFEFSFGSSQLYLFSDPGNATAVENRSVLPASAALLTGEFFLSDRLHALLGIHLPTSTRKEVVEGKVTEDYVAPYIGVGPLWEMYNADFRTYARFAIQASFLVGPVLRDDWNIIPAAVAGSRLHLVSKNGTSLYLGASWIVGIRAFALVYGVGQRF